MTDVFISYSRKDIAFARLLHEALIKNDLETWIDWQDIPPSADWLAEVYEAIEGADAFLFIISETSLASEICGLEIAHAAVHNKRLIPIVIKDVEAEQVPKELSVLNWIFFDEAGEKFAEAMDDLVTAITVDQAWVKGHTRFQNRALDWERKDRDHGTLLRGAELSEAETWLAGSAEKDPQPTALQTEYILKSREDATRRGRRTLMGVGAALVVAVGLGILAWTQRNVAVVEGQARATQQAIAEAASTQAIEQSNIAYSRYLGSQSLARKYDELDLALLLAVEAVNMTPSSEALGGLLSSISSREHFEVVLTKDSQLFVEELSLSEDGNYLAVSYLDRLGYGEYLSKIEVYDLSSNRLDNEIELFLPEGISSIWGLNFVNESQNLFFCQTGENEQGWSTSCALWDFEENRELETAISNIVDRVELTDHKSLSNDLMTKEPRSQSSLTVSPDGSYVSISNVNNDISIISLDGMDDSHWDLEGHDSRVTSAVFSSDSSMLATGDNDGIVILWDVSEGIQASDRIQVLCGEEDCSGGVTGLAFSPDGTLLLAAGAGKTVLFDPFNLTVKKRFVGYESQEILTHFSKDGTPIAFYFFNDSYMIRNAETGLLIGDKINTSFFLGTMQDEILDVNRLNLITASKLTDVRGASVNILNFLRRYPIEAQIQTEGEIETVTYHPDQSRLMLATGGCHLYESEDCVRGEVRIWDVETGEQVGEPLIGHTDKIEDIAFSPDGQLLATGSADSNVIVWDFYSREPIGDPLIAHQSGVSGIAFSPDGILLASVGFLSEGSVRIWDLGNEPPTSYLLGSDYTDLDAYDVVSFSPDGKKLVVCGEGSQGARVTVWDIESQSILHHLDTGKENITADTVAFVPNSNILITAGYAGIRIWNESTLISEPSLGTMDPPNIESIAVSSDGAIIAAMQDNNPLLNNNSIALYDGVTGQQIGDSIPLPSNEIIMMEDSRLSFSPDDSQLAVAGDFGVLIWDMRLNSWLESACVMANRNLTSEEWNTFLIGYPYRETCPLD